MSVAPALFGLFGILILSLRDVLRERQVLGYQRHIRGVLTLGLLISLGIYVSGVINLSASGVLILMTLAFLSYVWRSKHMRLFCEDSRQ